MQDELVELPVLEVVQRLQNGKAEIQELLDACDQVRQDLKSMTEQFEAQHLAEAEEIRTVLSPEVESIRRSSDLYSDVLDSLSSYAADFDAERLEEGLQFIPLAAERLSLDFLRYREAALAQRGPTTHPGINLLTTLVRSQATQEALQEALVLELERCHLWLDQDPSSSHLIPELQAFYATYLDHLQELSEDLNAWVGDLEELGRHYARLDIDGLRRRYAYGPSALPWINLVVHSSWLVTQNAVSSEVVRDLVGEAGQELEQALAGLGGWELSSDWTREAGQLLSDMLAWLEDLLRWLELCDHEGQASLSQRGLQLAAQYEPLMGQVQQQGAAEILRCEVCGNPVEGAKCGTCGARVHGSLLNPDEAEQENRMEALIKHAEMILREAGDKVAFGQLLDGLQNDLKIAKAKDPGEKVPEEFQPLRQRYLASLETFEQALADLEEFRISPSQEALEAAEEPLRIAVEELMELQQELQGNS